MKQYKWWQYPKNLNSIYSSWYVILWRAIWIVPVYASLLLLCFFMMMSYGIEDAKEVWERVT